MADFNRKQEYLTRLALAEGHRKFGLVAARKEPKDDDGGDSGTGAAGLHPPDFIRPHPLLGGAAQFGGEFPEENPVAYANPTGEKELQLRRDAKLDKQMQAEKHLDVKLGK
jgi:hypothetical protein